MYSNQRIEDVDDECCISVSPDRNSYSEWTNTTGHNYKTRPTVAATSRLNPLAPCFAPPTSRLNPLAPCFAPPTSRLNPLAPCFAPRYYSTPESTKVNSQTPVIASTTPPHVQTPTMSTEVTIPVTKTTTSRKVESNSLIMPIQQFEEERLKDILNEMEKAETLLKSEMNAAVKDMVEILFENVSKIVKTEIILNGKYDIAFHDLENGLADLNEIDISFHDIKSDKGANDYEFYEEDNPFVSLMGGF